MLTHPGLWILAQTEVNLLHPLVCQVPRHGSVVPHSAVEVPITQTSGQPQFEDSTKLFQLPTYLSPPIQLCHWQGSLARGRQQSDHTPQQGTHGTRAGLTLPWGCHCFTFAPSHTQGQAEIPKSLGDVHPCWSGCFKCHPPSFPRSCCTNLRACFRHLGSSKG